MHIVHSAAQCLSCGGACSGHSIRDQSRDFHTANYSKLINQHNLISCTHMQSACWCVAMCLQRVGTAAVWICLRGRGELLSHHHTQTHTLCPLLQSLHHIRGMFSGRLLCADRTPQSSARSTRATSHADSLLTSLNLWLRTTEPTRLKEEGGDKRAKSFACAQHDHAHTDRLDISNTWVKPLKSSSSSSWKG